MPGPIDYAKIAIMPDQDTTEWYDAFKRKEFLIRQCKDCGHRFYPPLPACKKCTSMNVGWHKIEGKGTIYSYIVVTQPILAHLVPTVPYVIAIVELPDGQNKDGTKTRIPALMLDDEKDCGIGAPVELAWDDHPKQDYKIPRWRVTDKHAKGVWHFPN